MNKTNKTNKTLKPIFLMIAAGCVLASFACRSTQPASVQLKDSAITAKVKAKIAADPEINPFNIDVDTEEGVVSLRGTVDDHETRREAVKIAFDTKGVRQVNDALTVGDKSMGESIDDREIAAKVKAKLVADPQVNPFNVDVDCNKGVVTLSGRVKTADQKLEAAKLARDTEGVKRVLNELEVGEPGR